MDSAKSGTISNNSVSPSPPLDLVHNTSAHRMNLTDTTKNQASFSKTSGTPIINGQCKTVRVSNLVRAVTSNLARLIGVFGKFGTIVKTDVRPEYFCAYIEYEQRESALAAVNTKRRLPFPQYKNRQGMFFLVTSSFFCLNTRVGMAICVVQNTM